MVISIFGRDGVGKTSISKALGRYLAKTDRGINIVVNTDITLPTTHVQDSDKFSLGYYLEGKGKRDPSPFLKQDDKIPNLFYAGTSIKDDYLSFENDGNIEQAKFFIEACQTDVAAQNIILDISGQRTDSFLVPALEYSDMVIMTTTCSIEGLYSVMAEKSKVFKSQRAAHTTVKYALSQQLDVLDKDEFERVSGVQISYVLPFCYELHYANAYNEDFKPIGKIAKAWAKQIEIMASDLALLKRQGVVNE